MKGGDTMTKKEAIEFCLKNSRKSKIKVVVSAIIAGLAIGNIFKNAYNAGVYKTGANDIEDSAADNEDVALLVNGKEV
jgi:formate/nitrite transporter FocA (FNT family)